MCLQDLQTDKLLFFLYFFSQAPHNANENTHKKKCPHWCFTEAINGPGSGDVLDCQAQQQALIPQFPTTPATSKPPLRSSAAVAISAVYSFPHVLHLPFARSSSVCLFSPLSLRSNVLRGSAVRYFRQQSTSKRGISESLTFSDEIFCLHSVCTM